MTIVPWDETPELCGLDRTIRVRTMATTLCGWCNTTSHMTRKTKELLTARTTWGNGYVSDAAYTCDNCGRMSVVTWWSSYDPTDNYRSGEPESYDRVTWAPLAGQNRQFPDVPEHIASAASEAFVCHTVGAYRGAGALARAVVEASAKELGVRSGNLNSKIDELHRRGLVRENIKDAAHEVRHLGNDVAHGDFADPTTAEESEEVLGLMEELLDELFQSPARVLRRRTKRLDPGQ
jgi:hypothetical protein